MLVILKGDEVRLAGHISALIDLGVVDRVSIAILTPSSNDLVDLLLPHQLFLLLDIRFLKRLEFLLQVETGSLRLLGEIYVID